MIITKKAQHLKSKADWLTVEAAGTWASEKRLQPAGP